MNALQRIRHWDWWFISGCCVVITTVCAILYAAVNQDKTPNECEKAGGHYKQDGTFYYAMFMVNGTFIRVQHPNYKCSVDEEIGVRP